MDPENKRNKVKIGKYHLSVKPYYFYFHGGIKQKGDANVQRTNTAYRLP